MIKKLISKCLLTLGLLLFFTLLMPLTSYNTGTAQAKETSIDEKKDDYRLNLKSRTLVKGKSFTLKAYNLSENAKISFKSDDPEIASVSDDGDITAKNVGTAIVTVTIKDGSNPTSSLPCEITVGPPAFSVKITKSRIILGGIDKTDSLNVILKPSNTAEDARFSSKNQAIAYISSGGRVTAKNYGMTYLFAEIDATSSDGKPKFAYCSVIVTNSEDAPLLETFFNDHPELNALSETDLLNALEEFFNTKYDGTTTTSIANGLDRFLNNKFESAFLTAKEAAALK
ncbi:MAG: Ig-like domain-containing protein [Mobilitalea sp.]